jgi:hypothetical protein
MAPPVHAEAAMKGVFTVVFTTLAVVGVASIAIVTMTVVMVTRKNRVLRRWESSLGRANVWEGHIPDVN